MINWKHYVHATLFSIVCNAVLCGIAVASISYFLKTQLDFGKMFSIACLVSALLNLVYCRE